MEFNPTEIITNLNIKTAVGREYKVCDLVSMYNRFGDELHVYLERHHNDPVRMELVEDGYICKLKSLPCDLLLEAYDAREEARSNYVHDNGKVKELNFNDDNNFRR